MLIKQEYQVEPNSCNCHPETCCCNDWAVYSTSGEKHSTHYKREVAELVAEALNAKNTTKESQNA